VKHTLISLASTDIELSPAEPMGVMLDAAAEVDQRGMYLVDSETGRWENMRAKDRGEIQYPSRLGGMKETRSAFVAAEVQTSHLPQVLQELALNHRNEAAAHSRLLVLNRLLFLYLGTLS
jgi:hypothetical protein